MQWFYRSLSSLGTVPKAVGCFGWTAVPATCCHMLAAGVIDPAHTEPCLGRSQRLSTSAAAWLPSRANDLAHHIGLMRKEGARPPQEPFAHCVQTKPVLAAEPGYS